MKQYSLFLTGLGLTGLLWLLWAEAGAQAARTSLYSLREMLLILPPIFVLLGLLDEWVPKETMVRFMGDKAGLRGTALAFALGSAAAGPLYGAFPIAAVFMKKGASYFNILVFLGAWSTTKIPLLIFEITSLGPAFAMTRLLVNIPGILLIAYLVDGFLRSEERDQVRQRISSM